MFFTDEMLASYSLPLSHTEDTKCKNAIRMIADALKMLNFTDDNAEVKPLYEDTLSYHLHLRSKDYSRSIKLFIQGSYANNTNVRTKSDVDVAIIQEEHFQTKYRSNQNDSTFGFKIAAKPVLSFKDEIQRCLSLTFGPDVERKNKSIKINGNSYRKDADTVPCLRYRDYRCNYGTNGNIYIPGVVITPDKGPQIINYPEQHIENGRKKNVATNHHYKKMVRIMKKMRYLMHDSNNSLFKTAADAVNSFMLESLLWNIPDWWYIHYCGSYTKTQAFAQLISQLQAIYDFTSYKEANGIKPLCADKIHEHNLKNYILQLSNFYEYA